MKVNKAVYNSLKVDKPINVQQGGTSCFGPNTLISTKSGPKKIKDIEVGELIKTCYIKNNEDIESVVSAIHKYYNTKPTIKLKLKDGREIIATEDHKFYFEGGWHSLKHILSLKDQKIKDK